MARIDLHAHTTASDGTQTPTELVRYAAEEGVTILGVTDHDTVDGVDEAIVAGAAAGVRIVPGVELSARLAGRSVHVLGLFLDLESPGLRDAFEGFRAERVDRARRMVGRLNELGYELTFDEVVAEARGDIVARPHVARAMVSRGYVESVKQAFTADLIADGGRADVPRAVPSPLEAIAWIRSFGGVAVLAHPGIAHHDGPENPLSDEVIVELVSHGLAGLEIDHPDQSPETRDRLRALAKRAGLVPTGGSDCHGREGAPPGTCTTAIECFDRLEALATADA